MSAAGGETGGPRSAARAAARALLQFAETRLRLVANESEEQLLRLFEIWLWGISAAFFFAVAVLMTAAFLVLLFWHTHPELAAAAIALLFFAAGAFAALNVRARLAARPRFLAATLGELRKDGERLDRP